MSLSDPLADMITRIRNGQSAGKKSVEMPASKIKSLVCQVLESQGYIEGFSIDRIGSHTKLTVQLKYFKGKGVIEAISRVSKPSRRVYQSNKDLPRVLGGLGVAVISTSRGVMSDCEARKLGLGGEILCLVS